MASDQAGSSSMEVSVESSNRAFTQELSLEAGQLLYAQDNVSLEERRFELLQQLSGKIVPEINPARKIETEVIVWRVAEQTQTKSGWVTQPASVFVVKFYNPARATERNIGGEASKVDFYYDQENYINQELRNVSDKVVRIVATGKVNNLSAPGQGTDEQSVRRFVIQTTLNGSVDLLALEAFLEANFLKPQRRQAETLPEAIQVCLMTIFEQISSTLDAMHKADIFHLDIKPENLIIGSPSSFNVEAIKEAWGEDVAKVSTAIRDQPNFVMMVAELFVTSDQMSDLDLKATKFVHNNIALIQAMVIDIDRSRSINGLEDLFDIGVDGTSEFIDPWVFKTNGVIPEYSFGPSTPLQQVRTAMMAQDYWSLGVTIFEHINGFNFLFEENGDLIEKAIRNPETLPTTIPGIDDDTITDYYPTDMPAEPRTFIGILRAMASANNIAVTKAVVSQLAGRGDLIIMDTMNSLPVWSALANLVSLDITTRFLDTNKKLRTLANVSKDLKTAREQNKRSTIQVKSSVSASMRIIP